MPVCPQFVAGFFPRWCSFLWLVPVSFLPVRPSLHLSFSFSLRLWCFQRLSSSFAGAGNLRSSLTSYFHVFPDYCFCLSVLPLVFCSRLSLSSCLSLFSVRAFVVGSSESSAVVSHQLFAFFPRGSCLVHSAFAVPSVFQPSCGPIFGAGKWTRNCHAEGVQ